MPHGSRYFPLSVAANRLTHLPNNNWLPLVVLNPSPVEGFFVLLCHMARDSFRYLLQQTGLLSCPSFFRDAQFYLALLAGLIVLSVMYFFFPVNTDIIRTGQWGLLFSLIL